MTQQEHTPRDPDDNQLDPREELADQWDKVIQQWARRLPEFRAENDPIEFAREMGVEIPPDQVERFRTSLRVASGLYSLFSLGDDCSTSEGLDATLSELHGGKLPPRKDDLSGG